jgi:Flp pilus assembly protein TadG
MSRRISADDRRAAPGRFARDRSGATAIEFVFIFPVLLVLTLGLLELTLILYDYHRAGEVMREAARTFVIDPPVTSFASMPLDCPTDADCDIAKMNAMVATIQNVMPDFVASNLEVAVEDSGLTDPANPGIVNPVVTVKIVGLQHNFFTTSRMAASQVP